MKHVISNLENGTTYEFWVSVKDAYGNESISDMPSAGEIDFTRIVTSDQGNTLINLAEVTDLTIDYQGVLEGQLIFGSSGRIFMEGSTTAFIDNPGTEMTGRGFRVYEDASKYALMEYDGTNARIELVGGTFSSSDILGGTMKTMPYCKLTVALGTSDTTATVDNTEGFSASGTCWLANQESFTYTGKTATTFTGLSTGRSFPYSIGHQIIEDGEGGIAIDGDDNRIWVFKDDGDRAIELGVSGTADPYLQFSSGSVVFFKVQGTDLDMANGTLTGGTIQTATSGQRVVIEGSPENNIKWYDGTYAPPRMEMDDGISLGFPGIRFNNVVGTAHGWITMAEVLLQSNVSYPSEKVVNITQSNPADASTYAFYGVVSDFTSNTYARDRCGLYSSASTGNAANTSIPIGVRARSSSANGSVLGIGVLSESDDIALRLAQYSDPTNDYVDFSVDANGYLSIDAIGDRVNFPTGHTLSIGTETITESQIQAWDSAGGSGDSIGAGNATLTITNPSASYATLTLDTGAENAVIQVEDSTGDLSLIASGGGDYINLITDTVRIWNEAEGAGDYADFLVDTNGDLTIDANGNDVKFPTGHTLSIGTETITEAKIQSWDSGGSPDTLTAGTSTLVLTEPGDDLVVTLTTGASAETVNWFLEDTTGDLTLTATGNTYNIVSTNLQHNGSNLITAGDVDDTPVNGETAVPVSSNWAYDHINPTYQPHNGLSTTGLSTADTLVLSHSASPSGSALLTIGAYTVSGSFTVQYGSFGTIIDDTSSAALINFTSTNLQHNSSAILTAGDVDDTPVDSATAVPVSSNWAYDHVNTNHHDRIIDGVNSGLQVDDTTSETSLYLNYQAETATLTIDSDGECTFDCDGELLNITTTNLQHNGTAVSLSGHTHNNSFTTNLPFVFSGTVSNGTSPPVLVPDTLEVTAVKCNTSAGTCTVDVQVNGTSVLTGTVSVDSDATWETGTIKTDGTEDLSADDEITVVVSSVSSCSNLSVNVFCANTKSVS